MTMTFESIGLLRKAARSRGAQAQRSRVYVFGSNLEPGGGATDTDVLLVYPDGELVEAHSFAEQLRGLSVLPPLDVIALSAAEEDETSFVLGVGAVEIWPLRLGN